MEEKESQARRIVTKYMWWSMGAGLVPIPVWDLALITGIQLKMAKDLADHYEIPFSKDRVKLILSSLVGSMVPGTIAYGPIGTMLKFIPIVGPFAGAVAMPVFAGASTYAVGKVFIQHFESGGTLLDFEPAKVREYFRQEFEKGKELASQMKSEKGKESFTQANPAKA